MLLAAEGGGFFSSSASGYSKGLTLLLLGHKHEEKPMRVTPWTHYQLVDHETDPAVLQLAPGKNRLVRGCASFVCFGRAAAGPEGPSPPKAGPAQNQEVLPGPPLDFDDESKDPVNGDDDDDDDRNREIDISLKSSLKKSVNIAPVAGEIDNDITCQTERRNVQWTDAIGGELFEVREFEMR
ncbi:hypothetical protein PHJA_000837200 [Phtheirospermum japonicum]|uniref:Uncharacterized protein n=1 Tax=Phtheirospermum japonicum TaxID=374723 RepID=A0A830BR30_9LAMI|nr:hypothetical protein PHJA_000837200 [Phtheirospermum japonicum]